MKCHGFQNPLEMPRWKETSFLSPTIINKNSSNNKHKHNKMNKTKFTTALKTADQNQHKTPICDKSEELGANHQHGGDVVALLIQFRSPQWHIAAEFGESETSPRLTCRGPKNPEISHNNSLGKATNLCQGSATSQPVKKELGIGIYWTIDLIWSDSDPSNLPTSSVPAVYHGISGPTRSRVQ